MKKKFKRSLWSHAWCQKYIFYWLLKVFAWIFYWSWYFFLSHTLTSKQPRKIVQIHMTHPVNGLGLSSNIQKMLEIHTKKEHGHEVQNHQQYQCQFIRITSEPVWFGSKLSPWNHHSVFSRIKVVYMSFKILQLAIGSRNLSQAKLLLK